MPDAESSLCSRRRLFGAALLPLLGGCRLLMTPPSRVPMELLRDSAPCRAADLLVMLPGAYSTPRELIDEGLVTEVRRRDLAADTVVADAHMGYFVERSVLQRLRDDVILPARQRGIARIWLVGISLGGFIALSYAARHPGEVDGVLALAPYLGRRTLHLEMAAAGGGAAWLHKLAPSSDEDPDRDLWQWLIRTGPKPPVYLGFGREDRFAESHRLLIPLLPADHSFDAAGGHDWPAWRTLWSTWLDRGLLPRCGGDPQG